MPFVQRDETSGQIIGQYATEQPDFAKEWLSEDHADLKAIAIGEAVLGVKIAIEEEYARRLAMGFEYQPGSARCVQIRPQDQQNLTAMALQALMAKSGVLTWDPHFSWRLADNTDLAVPTADAMILLAKASSDRVVRLRLAARQHKDAVAAQSTISGVLAYDFTAGWP